MKNVSVIGASGYTGGELLRILAGHPEVEVSHATSRSFKGREVFRAHPNLRGVYDLRFEDLSPEEVSKDSDLVFTAIPHKTSMKIVPKLLMGGVKVIDLSGDFRFNDKTVYNRYYGVEHSHPEIEAVYGLPEMHREEIRDADLVANPGCYPTSVILGAAPALNKGFVEPERIIADSKSGVSGAGARPAHSSHFCQADESVLAYNPAGHRHMPEMEQELAYYNRSVKVSFVPHLVPVTRGLSTTLHFFLTGGVSEEEIRGTYEDFYKGEPFVRLLDVGEVPRMNAVRGSNFCDIGCFKIDEERNRLIVVAAIDNLVKGAAGQAVQNMNLMIGFDESTALGSAGFHP